MKYSKQKFGKILKIGKISLKLLQEIRTIEHPQDLDESGCTHQVKTLRWLVDLKYCPGCDTIPNFVMWLVGSTKTVIFLYFELKFLKFHLLFTDSSRIYFCFLILSI